MNLKDDKKKNNFEKTKKIFIEIMIIDFIYLVIDLILSMTTASNATSILAHIIMALYPVFVAIGLFLSVKNSFWAGIIGVISGCLFLTGGYIDIILGIILIIISAKYLYDYCEKNK